MTMTNDQEDQKREREPLTEDQEKALERINLHLDCIKDTINANWDKDNLKHWLRLTYDHKHRSNGHEFKEDIEPRVRNLRVD